MRIAVLTISDACAAGLREDLSGKELRDWAAAAGHVVAASVTVPDDTVEIVRCLLSWCDGDVADLVFTTGGTGLSPRDYTAAACKVVIERPAPGIAERLRVSELNRFPRAALSQAVAGIRARTLIITLPGSPSGVRDALGTLAPIIAHAVDIARGEPTDHSGRIGR
ncbi:MAG: MogA/MoaB family molybdenum cofactor biosynthesis protein [Gemmatimonadota bacterium]